MRIRMLHDHILIREDEPETRTRGGLHIPDTVQAKEKPQRGTVLEVGNGKRDPHTGERRALNVSPGDVVAFSAYLGYPVELDGYEGKLRVLREEDVLFAIGDDATLLPVEKPAGSSVHPS